MLKITRKVEYALIALKHMQSKEGESLSTAKEIAYQYNVPQQLLAKSLQQMSKNNIIEATKGINGGYRIKANLSGISLKTLFSKFLFASFKSTFGSEIETSILYFLR